jgi:IS605 OrfB family transposase
MKLTHHKKKKISRRRNTKMKTLRRKIQNFVTELHWKTADFLTKNYKNILLGDMSSKGIVSKKKSNLQDVSKRMCYALSFNKFRQRLNHKCNQRGNNYYNINERYTSKTCSFCGEYNETLGGSKYFKCPHCKKELDRDVNSGRNILIKSLN